MAKSLMRNIIFTLLLLLATVATFAQTIKPDSLATDTAQNLGADAVIMNVTNWALDVMTTEKPA